MAYKNIYTDYYFKQFLDEEKRELQKEHEHKCRIEPFDYFSTLTIREKSPDGWYVVDMPKHPGKYMVVSENGTTLLNGTNGNGYKTVEAARKAKMYKSGWRR